MSRRRFLIAAAGTGGHIIPGIQIGRRLMETSGGALDVEYLCGEREIERRIYTAEGIEPRTLPLRGPSSYGLPGGYKFAVVANCLRAISFFSRNRPVGILAMGGAVCFPALIAARLLGIPYFLHESNRIPGRVVRLFRGSACKVFAGFEDMTGSQHVYTGTPGKPAASGDIVRDAVVCVGGSQGASALSDAFIAAANSELLAGDASQYILVAGPGRSHPGSGRVEIREYEPDMPGLLARARVVVSRSGSGGLCDIAAAGVPAVVVPYPHAMDNHQLANARYFAERGAVELLEEKNLTPESLADVIYRLLTLNEVRLLMEQNLALLHKPDAAGEIATHILRDLARSISEPSLMQVQHDHS